MLGQLKALGDRHGLLDHRWLMVGSRRPRHLEPPSRWPSWPRQPGSGAASPIKLYSLLEGPGATACAGFGGGGVVRGMVTPLQASQAGATQAHDDPPAPADRR